MSELKKTMAFAAVAAAVVLAAWLSAPRRVTPDAFLDRGQPFIPDFTDPNAATTLEVVEYSEEEGAAKPFKVTFEDGRWTIPSHHGYPADARDRLARTAAGIIAIRKDDFRSDNAADHPACGVVDPLDDKAASPQGRGRRVTVRGKGGEVLADLILGKELADRPGSRFVRLADRKRVYAARVDLDLSTSFADWIEQDLLGTKPEDIARLLLLDYSIDEGTRMVRKRDAVALKKDATTWSIDGDARGATADSAKVQGLASAVAGLSIVGVRRKPEGLTRDLSAGQGLHLSQEDMLSLQGRGYYVTGDGRLLSNEGELQATTTDGVVYTLRFGEVAYGTGEALTAGTASSDGARGGPGENRYLFVTASVSPELVAPEPPEGAAAGDRAAWQAKGGAARQRVAELNRRFADWYYVISAESYRKVALKRADLAP